MPCHRELFSRDRCGLHRGGEELLLSTVKEIEAAICALPPQEREKLVEDLPAILPEMNGDAAWERIITDPRPRPALMALGDEIEAQLKANPRRFSEIQDSDFDQRP